MRLNCVPHSYIFLITNVKLFNQFGNTFSQTKFNPNSYQRGSVTQGTQSGNFFFNWNFDFRVKLASWQTGVISQTIGLSSFYEGFIVTDDYNFVSQATPIEYKNVVGGGLWLRLGSPINLSIFAELGYTIGEEFSKGYKINIGLRDFF